MKRDGYQPKPPKDGKKPRPPRGGSDVQESTPELKFTPNDAPRKIYLQVTELEDIPWHEVSWCPDQIDESDQEYIRADLYDDPLSDCTDFAHPAWWRAEEYSFFMMCHRITEYLDGDYAGTSQKELEVIKNRIKELRERPPAAFTIQCTLVLGVALGVALTYFFPF